MAAIADEASASDRERRERLREIWAPMAKALIDNIAAAPEAEAAYAAKVSDPNFVGVTCDSKRPVFLDRETSGAGFVYRKFVVARGTPCAE
ncbi:hypothetical protein [Methylocystis parvus]|uniref:Uncharacterized protein n=1 Tax=Methylocystis parvus TaxID=134 RepID=A0A6B8M4W7_9HYPH|nr:hypothetical protein [Methylocystis parvus]QGM96819.1 hypothetical protein F7D14_04565 [Methylocystis parvus]WBJ99303.1 hypothetical protein MMG94_15060 [Methylocystis parvus OBBP]